MSLSHPSRDSHGRKERVSKEMQEQAGVTRKLPRSGLVQLPLIDIVSVAPRHQREEAGPIAFLGQRPCATRQSSLLRCSAALLTAISGEVRL
jgi:hypothetical protein